MLSEPGWLSWFSSLIGVELSQSTLIPLTTKTKENSSEEKITSTAIIQRVGGRTKVLLLMMGNNNLPKAKGIARLAQAMSGK